MAFNGIKLTYYIQLNLCGLFELSTQTPEGDLYMHESGSDEIPMVINPLIMELRKSNNIPPLRIEIKPKEKEGALSLTKGMHGAVLEGLLHLFGHDCSNDIASINIARNGGFHLIQDHLVRLNHVDGLFISIVKVLEPKNARFHTLNASDCALLSVGLSLTNLQYIETALKGREHPPSGWGLFRDQDAVFSFSANSNDAESVLSELKEMFHVEHGHISKVNIEGVKLN